MCWIHSWLVITFGDETFHSRFEQEWRLRKNRRIQRIGRIMDPVCRAVGTVFPSEWGGRCQETTSNSTQCLRIYFNQRSLRRQLSKRLSTPSGSTLTKIVECYKFHSRNRKEDEGVAAYVAELRISELNIVILTRRYQKCYEIGWSVV